MSYYYYYVLFGSHIFVNTMSELPEMLDLNFLIIIIIARHLLSALMHAMRPLGAGHYYRCHRESSEPCRLTRMQPMAEKLGANLTAIRL